MSVKAWCEICSDDTEKFESANTTTNDDLGVKTRDAWESESQHFGAPLFQRGKYVRHEMDQLAQRHMKTPWQSWWRNSAVRLRRVTTLPTRRQALLVRDVPTGTECVIGGKGFKLLTDHIPASWVTVALADID